MTEFQDRFRRIAVDFLRTAVVLDDKAYLSVDEPGVALRPPLARRSYRSGDADSVDRGRAAHDLDTARVIGGFAHHGILCSVLGIDGVGGTGEIDGLMDRADVVVLDWQMQGDGGVFALDRLRHLAADESRLRIVAVYTGEARLDLVAERIRSSGDTDESCWQVLSSGMLQSGSCYVALYCKPGATPRPEFVNRIVREEELADRVVNDFVTVTAGLLPAVVLTALTSVRDNAYRLLTGLAGRLDPAFLCHRSCLTTPEDAEALIVRMISGEIEEILEEAVAIQKPAGREAVGSWLEARKLNDQLLADLRRLLVGSCGPIQLSSPEFRGMKPKKRYQWLTNFLVEKVLVENGDAERLNLEFAWLASHRTVDRPGSRRLHLGTIVQNGGSESEEYYPALFTRGCCEGGGVRRQGQ